MHKQVNRQASVARKSFAEFFGMFSTSIHKIIPDAQISGYKKKMLSKKLKIYDTLQDNTNTTSTAPSHLHSLSNNHTLSLISQNYRNTISTTLRIIHTCKNNVALYLK